MVQRRRKNTCWLACLPDGYMQFSVISVSEIDFTDSMNSADTPPSHPLMIHVHSMKIRFPCPDDVWQKDNVMSWAMAKAQMPQLPSLLEASRSLISKCEILPGTSNFVAWILLHALISISWALVSSTAVLARNNCLTPLFHSSCGGTWPTYVRLIRVLRRLRDLIPFAYSHVKSQSS